MTKVDSLYTAKMVKAMSTSAMAQNVRKFVETLQTSYFNLGGLLQRVRDEGLFVDWEEYEYDSFETWCDDVLKFRMRKAQHLITIYKSVNDLQPPKPIMQKLLEMGWVKVGQILRIADTLPKLVKWVKKADGLSLRELQGKINYALEHAGGKTVDDEALALADETTLRKFRMTETESESLDKAMDILSKRFPSETDGARLNMMVLAFMSGHVEDEKGGFAVELGYLLTNIERTYGVKLKVTKTLLSPKKKQKGKKAS